MKVSECLLLLIEASLKLNNNMNPIDFKDIYAMQEVSYFIAIGCFMHAMIHTRLHVAYLVGQMARYMANPSQAHWYVIKCILRHIKRTLNNKITYQRSSSPTTQYLHQIQRCNDADWVNDEDSRKSTSGYVFVLVGGTISWQNKHQQTIVLSSNEHIANCF